MNEQSKHRREIFEEFFERCGFEVDQLPPEAWEMFKFINYRRFIEPMILQDRKKGIKPGQIQTYFQINRNIYKNIKKQKTTQKQTWKPGRNI